MATDSGIASDPPYCARPRTRSRVALLRCVNRRSANGRTRVASVSDKVGPRVPGTSARMSAPQGQRQTVRPRVTTDGSAFRSLAEAELTKISRAGLLGDSTSANLPANYLLLVIHRRWCGRTNGTIVMRSEQHRRHPTQSVSVAHFPGGAAASGRLDEYRFVQRQLTRVGHLRCPWCLPTFVIPNNWKRQRTVAVAGARSSDGGPASLGGRE
jgi:hypothetical protein